MKSAVIRLLGNRRLCYLSCLVGSLLSILSLFILFFTGLALEVVGSLFIFSILLYTLSWISYVWRDRRISNSLIRESRALQVAVAAWGEPTIRDLSEHQTKMSRSLVDLEKNLSSFLDEYHQSYIEELKVQAFNSHLAVQDLKSFMCAERNYDG